MNLYENTKSTKKYTGKSRKDQTEKLCTAIDRKNKNEQNGRVCEGKTKMQGVRNRKDKGKEEGTKMSKI